MTFPHQQLCKRHFTEQRASSMMFAK